MSEEINQELLAIAKNTRRFLISDMASQGEDGQDALKLLNAAIARAESTVKAVKREEGDELQIKLD